MSSKKDILGSIVRAMVGVPITFLGVILDLCNKLAGSDGKLWYEKIGAMLRESVAVMKAAVKHADYSRFITACDGTVTLGQAKNLHPGYTESSFKNLRLDTPRTATDVTQINVYRNVSRRIFNDLFLLFSKNLNNLCLTQHQIVVFCEENQGWMEQSGYSNLFLIKEADKFFVVNVEMFDRLSVSVYSLFPGDFFFVDRSIRIIIPVFEDEDRVQSFVL